MSTAGHPFAPPAHERRWVDTATELAAEFAKTAGALDQSAELPLANLQALHGSGLDAALLPKELGGEALSYRSYGEIVRLLSAACPSTACIWVMHIGAGVGLAEISAPESARFYADELIAGRRFANALSEPTSGNLFMMPLQHAEPVDGGFRLTGAKRFASGCEIADHFLVNALVGDVPTFFGLAADPATMTYIPIWDTMGLRASRSQLIEFTGTLLREDRRCPAFRPKRPNHIGAGLAFLSLGIADRWRGCSGCGSTSPTCTPGSRPRPCTRGTCVGSPTRTRRSSSWRPSAPSSWPTRSPWTPHNSPCASAARRPATCAVRRSSGSSGTRRPAG
jgi:hypothetical protein